MGEKGSGEVFKLVDDAIRSLGEARSTAKEIVKFISANRTMDDQMILCIYKSLKRGMDDGFFRENEGRFSLSVHPTPHLNINTNKEEMEPSC